MFNIFKNIFGKKNTQIGMRSINNNIDKPNYDNKIKYVIDFVYSYEIGDTIKNSIVEFPNSFDEILINGKSYFLDTYYVNDIGYSDDKKYCKIKIPDFVFWVTPKDFKSFKAILNNRHIEYMENKRLKMENRKEQIKLDYKTPFEYDEIDNDIYKCFIAYKSGMSDNIGSWDNFYKVENEILNICSANEGRYYKSPAKSAKFAIIFSPHNRTYSIVQSLKEKGYKVTTFEKALVYFKLEHMWDIKSLVKVEKDTKEYLLKQYL